MLRFCCIEFILGEVPKLAHARKHEILAVLKRVAIVTVRREVGWRLRKGGKVCSLCNGNVFSRFAEERARRRFNAVQSTAVRRVVEIECEDLILSEALFELDSEHPLMHLTHDGFIVGEERVFDYLLRERGAALCVTLGKSSPNLNIDNDGANNRWDTNTIMVVEGRVFNSDGCFANIWIDILQRNDAAGDVGVQVMQHGLAGTI